MKVTEQLKKQCQKAIKKGYKNIYSIKNNNINSLTISIVPVEFVLKSKLNCKTQENIITVNKKDISKQDISFKNIFKL